MSVYARLLALSGSRTYAEDALTEVVAHLFTRDAETRDAAGRPLDDALVVRWLRSLQVIDALPVTGVHVTPQQWLPEADEGAVDVSPRPKSRADMTVVLTRADGTRDVVVVESKVGSREGSGQLERYARDLRALAGTAAVPDGRMAVVFVTRDREPKEADRFEDAIRVRLVVARWHAFHALASRERAGAPERLRGLYDDVLAYMSHLSMDLDLSLTADDVRALERLPALLRLMEHTLIDGSDGPGSSPAERFAGRTGARPRAGSALLQLQRHRRYMLLAKRVDPGAALLEVLLGYAFDGDAPSLRLEVGCLLHENGSARVSDLVRGLSGQPVPGLGAAWETHAWPEVRWLVARVSVPLLAPEAGEPAGALGATLHALLDEFERVREALPGVPWPREPGP